VCVCVCVCVRECGGTQNRVDTTRTAVLKERPATVNMYVRNV